MRLRQSIIKLVAEQGVPYQRRITLKAHRRLLQPLLFSVLATSALLLTVRLARGTDGSSSGVSVIYEAIHGRVLPADEDADYDGLNNYREYLLGTNPLDPASPGDFGLSITGTTARMWIPNQRGLRFKLQMTADLEHWDEGSEWEIADGSRDVAEIDIEGLSRFFFRIKPAPPLDSDEDGLNDWEEKIIGTNPTLVDSDGDGYTDLDEYLAGSDPNDPNSVPSVILEKAAHFIQVYNTAPPGILFGHAWSNPTTVQNLSAPISLYGSAWSNVTTVQNTTASLNLNGPVLSAPVVVHNAAIALARLPELWSPPILVFNHVD